jgi:hypothetical protein
MLDFMRSLKKMGSRVFLVEGLLGSVKKKLPDSLEALILLVIPARLDQL